jgi:hypothetical protein
MPETLDERGDGQGMSHEADYGPIHIRTVADFLRLSGLRVQFTTSAGEYYEATVRDLSDSASHLRLEDVYRIEYSDDPHDKIVAVGKRGLVMPDDLPSHVGECVRLQIRAGGFLEGILHDAPRLLGDLRLTGLTRYRSCDMELISLADVRFVEVVDRRGIRS